MIEETVKKALAQWGMPEAKFTLAAKRENTVFRITTASADYALRLHRMGYRTKAELNSELLWMAALRTENIRVPKPLASPSGALIAEVDGILIDVLEWLPGTQVGSAGTLPKHIDRTQFCLDLGRTMAKLHDISDLWTRPENFYRPSWDREGLLGSNPIWGRFTGNPMLSPPEREILVTTQNNASIQLENLENTADFGLIHADLLSENIMLDDDNLYMIDFDDSGFGFRDFELATFLLRFLEAPDYEDLENALIEGYGARRPVNHDHLHFFLLLRALTYVGWIVPRMNEENGAAKSATAINRALKLARKYLS
ncbi:MAG: phosphotransferase [Rhodobacterales bacterium]|nr:phosphotransferase [Rhodobacterales bacterium]